MPLPDPTFYPDMVSAPITITIPDGAGGFQNYSLPNYSVMVSQPGDYGMSGFFCMMLSLLNSIWGETVAAGTGIVGTPVTATGNSTFGTV